MYKRQDYVDAFLPFVKAGIPIICICTTTKFSGSMQSALNAKAILEEEYPNAQIYVCDSTVNTVLQGIYVLEAVRLRDAGKSYQESIDRLNEIKSSGRIFFTVGNMEYLKPWDVVKFVIGSREDLNRAKEIIERFRLCEKAIVYFSPVFGKIEPEEIVEFMKENKLNKVRFQIQIHKVVWDPDKTGV